MLQSARTQPQRSPAKTRQNRSSDALNESPATTSKSSRKHTGKHPHQPKARNKVKPMTGKQKAVTRSYEEKILRGGKEKNGAEPAQDDRPSVEELTSALNTLDTLISQGVIDTDSGSQVQNQILRHLDRVNHSEPPHTRETHTHGFDDGHTGVIHQ